MPSGLYTPPFFPNGTFYYQFPTTLAGAWGYSGFSYYFEEPFGPVKGFDASFRFAVTPSPDDCGDWGVNKHSCYTPSLARFQTRRSGPTEFSVGNVGNFFTKPHVINNEFAACGGRFRFVGQSSTSLKDRYAWSISLNANGPSFSRTYIIMYKRDTGGSIRIRTSTDNLTTIESDDYIGPIGSSIDDFLEIVAQGNNVTFYRNGSPLATVAGDITPDWEDIDWDFGFSRGHVTDADATTFSDSHYFVMPHAGLPNASAGVIPTSSILLPESTAKPSYIRMLRGGRGKSQAEAFHELMKRKVR